MDVWKTHVERGMLSAFDVSGRSEASAPTADRSISFDAEKVTAPALAPGTTTISVRNDGTAAGDFNIVRLEAGKKLSDIDAWFGNPEAPPPATFLGGTHGIEPGKAVTMTVSLEPGTYTLAGSYEEPEHKEVTTQVTVA